MHQPKLTFTDKFNLIAGIIVPAIAITVEAGTHVCARMYFNPIPSAWHMVLVILVPLAQLHVWYAIRRGAPDRLALAGDYVRLPFSSALMERAAASGVLAAHTVLAPPAR